MTTELDRDLGFGSAVAKESRQRLLNRDGSFNVERRGGNLLRSLNHYHWLLSMTWPRFLGLLIGVYCVINVVFALGYMACGPHALLRADGIPTNGSFGDAFFFSVQTFTTIGYGEISPAGLAPNLLVSVEALGSLLSVALATGLIFARFARPQARIRFSRHAVIAPYQGITAFEFRIVNTWDSEVVELSCQLTLARFETKEGERSRRFYPLALERSKVTFFPLTWTVVHPIDASSPLYGETPDSLKAAQAEFFILLSGVEETFSQTVHARSSYTAEEILWGVRFASVFVPPSERGVSRIDVARLDQVIPA
jgi:inward rectifier potassium channel